MKVTIDTTGVYGCCIKGCRSTGPTYRHHKGCDNMIGTYNDRVREEYPLFLDCCRVCDKHHMWIHFNYKRILRSWSDFTPAGALRLRAKLIAKCDRLISGEDKLNKPTKQFVENWRRRRRAWKKAMKLGRKLR